MAMDTGGNSLPSASCPDDKKRRVCYYYDPSIANVDYGVEHVMVPRRVAMAHGLVASYGLLGEMRRLRTRPATADELTEFHEGGYVDLLRELTPDDYHRGGAIEQRARKHGIGLLPEDDSYDNPVIDGLWDYCLRYAGGSLAAARALGSGSSDIAINWSGGMHHACVEEAKGFCYVNDIVLAIKELLKHFRRVLYVDIDVHHGDGVEKAFEESNQVMTVSFHQYGDNFFPRTGKIDDVGKNDGKYRSLNVPMKPGMDNAGYHSLFGPIMEKVNQVFQPEAIVLQCGADSLSGDRLGRFNLSVGGHAGCVSYLRTLNVPLLLLGGGGYTTNHVASCWCYETAVAVGKDISNDIPHHGYEHYYKKQDYKLHYAAKTVHRNGNTRESMEDTKQKALEHLSSLEAAPSVHFSEPTGSSIDVEALYERSPSEEEEDPMERLHRLCGEADLNKLFVRLGQKQRRLG